MKKLSLMAMLFFIGAFSESAFAQVVQNIPLQIIKGGEVDKGNTKMPQRPLIITQEDNLLTIPASGVYYNLQLRDENGTVVYTMFVPAGTTQIILPPTLTGDFEIRFVTDTYYYIGYLTL